MKPSAVQEVAPAPRGLLAALGLLRRRATALVAAARAWRWGVVAGKVALAASGLVLLGAIGRSALARNILTPEAPAPVVAGAVTAAASHGVEASPIPPLPAAASLPTPAPAPAPAPAPTPSAEASRGHATPEDPVYLNQATLADLHRLPGVGPKRAEAILALRVRLGHFRQIEDLLKVKGIGRSSLRKLRPLVRLDLPPPRAIDAGTVDAA